MTKKNVGLAKTDVIRIHPHLRQDLNYIKQSLKMGSRHNENDVIQQLVLMFKSGEIQKTPFLVTHPSNTREIELQTKLEEFETLYEDQQKANQTMVKAVHHLCEKHHETYGDVIDHVKHQ